MEASKVKILLVEDDPTLGFVIKDNLEESGYEVAYCHDGETAWQQFMRNNIDLCLLDVMLPKKDGMVLAQQIRKKNEQIPILFMTARSMDADRIAGFKAGGDDYITKPFNMEELLLRIEVFIKRTKNTDKDNVQQYTIGNLKFDYKQLSIQVNGKNFQLTQKEADLFKYLCDHQDAVVKREDILMSVWGKDDYFLGRSMDVFMTKIRKYIKETEEIELQTLHGIGFKFMVKK